jgi:hypothetical protein
LISGFRRPKLPLAVDGSETTCGVAFGAPSGWEDWDIEDHPNKAEYVKAVQAFDDLYHRANDLLSRSCGTAIARGCYRIERQRLRWAMWPGSGGLRILAQDEPYIQLGMELDIWLVPWREGEDLPEMPLF